MTREQLLKKSFDAIIEEKLQEKKTDDFIMDYAKSIVGMMPLQYNVIKDDDAINQLQNDVAHDIREVIDVFVKFGIDTAMLLTEGIEPYMIDESEN